jgi:hypothetical protein
VVLGVKRIIASDSPGSDRTAVVQGQAVRNQLLRAVQQSSQQTGQFCLDLRPVFLGTELAVPDDLKTSAAPVEA